MSVVPLDSKGQVKFFMFQSVKKLIQSFVHILATHMLYCNREDKYKNKSLQIVNGHSNCVINKYIGSLDSWNKKVFREQLHVYRKTFLYILDNDNFYRSLVFKLAKQIASDPKFIATLEKEKLVLK